MAWWETLGMLFGILTVLLLAGIPAAFAFLAINLVGAVVNAIQFMDTHARAAHVTRIYTERFHPDQVMITEAMKGRLAAKASGICAGSSPCRRAIST